MRAQFRGWTGDRVGIPTRRRLHGVVTQFSDFQGRRSGDLGMPARCTFCNACAIRRTASARGVAVSGWSGLDFFADASAQRRSRTHRERIRGRRILYVDDELLMRLAVARLLRGAGAVCIGSDSHDQAVVLLAFEPRLDLAILDFQMPDGDVARLVERLRWQQPGIPLVGTSATDRSSEFAARAVDRFLPKPWTLDDLIRVADWS